MTIKNRIEAFVGERVKGGLITVYCFEKACKNNVAVLAFAVVLFIPVIVIAIFH